MIVVDENLSDRRLIAAISAWYPGQVVSLTSLRPGSVIKDEVIPELLRQLTRPTFITNNVTDFWRKTKPHRGFCIITIELPKERILEVPALLQRLFHLRGFKTRAVRMGKIVRVTPDRIEYYDLDLARRIIPWN